MKRIKNIKEIQNRSRANIITCVQGNTYMVTSGASGRSYMVKVFEHGATCTCKWAQNRPGVDPRSGCSHVVAVYNHIAHESGRARNVSAWASEEDARRQHRPITAIGDGVILTGVVV